MAGSPFDDLLKLASAMLGAAGAFLLAWRGRSGQEPHLSDIGDRPAKVAAVIIAVFLAVMIYDDGKSFGLPAPGRLVAWCIALALGGLLAYLFLIRVLGYVKEVPISETRTKTLYIIGGLWLTSRAREMKRGGAPVQKLLKRAGYEADLIWPRPAVALSQLLVVIAYISLMVGTSTALALGALILQRSLAAAP